MALLFDMDGVVVDSMLLHTEIEAAMFSAAGIERTPQMLTQQFAGIGLKGMIATLQAENGITLPPDFAEQVARKKEEHFQGRLQPTPHLVEALSQLADTPRCIASGAALRRVEFCLRLTDITDFFAPHLYSSDMVARGKPAPDLFLYAAQKLGADPHDCIVIEDAVAGVKAGKAAGMRVLGYDGGVHCWPGYGDDLRAAGADVVFNDMRRLPELVALR